MKDTTHLQEDSKPISPSSCLDGRPLIIVALPSTGSDWFAECVASAAGFNYIRERFNPMCDWTRADMLANNHFASESSLTLMHLGKPHAEGFDVVGDLQSSRFNMTKEVWSLGKYAQYAEVANVVAIDRTPEKTFPPTRARVLNWYHSVAEKMGWLEALDNVPCDNLVVGKALASYIRLRRMHLAEAAAVGIPIITWESLVTGTIAEVCTSCKSLPVAPVDAERVVGRILTTRTPR